MKKTLFFAAAFVAALTFSACGGKSTAEAPAADSTEVVVDANVDPETQQAVTSITDVLTKALESKDAATVKATLADIAAKYQELVNAGKLEEAKSYAAILKEYVNKNAEALKNITSGDATSTSTISNLVTTIANLPTSAETTAEEAKSAAVSAAETAAAAVKNAPEAVKNAAETAAKTAVSNAEEKATEAVNKEVDKAQKKASDAVEKTQKKANDAVNDAANKALKGLGL